jgi:hypothetical protein
MRRRPSRGIKHTIEAVRRAENWSPGRIARAPESAHTCVHIVVDFGVHWLPWDILTCIGSGGGGRGKSGGAVTRLSAARSSISVTSDIVAASVDAVLKRGLLWRCRRHGWQRWRRPLPLPETSTTAV